MSLKGADGLGSAAAAILPRQHPLPSAGQGPAASTNPTAGRLGEGWAKGWGKKWALRVVEARHRGSQSPPAPLRRHRGRVGWRGDRQRFASTQVPPCRERGDAGLASSLLPRGLKLLRVKRRRAVTSRGSPRHRRAGSAQPGSCRRSRSLETPGQPQELSPAPGWPRRLLPPHGTAPQPSRGCGGRAPPGQGKTRSLRPAPLGCHLPSPEGFGVTKGSWQAGCWVPGASSTAGAGRCRCRREKPVALSGIKVDEIFRTLAIRWGPG